MSDRFMLMFVVVAAAVLDPPSESKVDESSECIYGESSPCNTSPWILLVWICLPLITAWTSLIVGWQGVSQTLRWTLFSTLIVLCLISVVFVSFASIENKRRVSNVSPNVPLRAVYSKYKDSTDVGTTLSVPSTSTILDKNPVSVEKQVKQKKTPNTVLSSQSHGDALKAVIIARGAAMNKHNASDSDSD